MIECTNTYKYFERGVMIFSFFTVDDEVNDAVDNSRENKSRLRIHWNVKTDRKLG